MNSRRKFLIQGSLATTAVLALNPFTTFAKTASSFSFLNGSDDKLVILHTGNLHSTNDSRVIRHINEIRNKNRNAILLKAGQDVQDESGILVYDVSISGSNDSSAIAGDYKIITKGKLRTGVISAMPDEKNIFEKINTLSAYLKKEKNCAVVVCLSRLGYKNKNTPDDITLARNSTHLDVIICGNKGNFPKYPVIELNNTKAEVIIHSAAGTAAYGKIEIDFTEKGQKKFVSFTDHRTISGQAMPAA